MDEAAILPYREYHARRDREVRQEREGLRLRVQLDKAGWHRELLQRMRLDLTPLRPAVIDAEAYDRFGRDAALSSRFQDAGEILSRVVEASYEPPSLENSHRRQTA